MACCSFGAGDSALFSFDDANWEGDACTLGGLDADTPGDSATLVVSGDKAFNHPSSLELPVVLEKDFSAANEVIFEIGLRSNAMQTTRGSLYWDDVLIAELNAYGPGEELKVVRQTVRPDRVSLKKGEHKIRIAAEDTSNEWDFLQLDALSIREAKDTTIANGIRIPYEILPLEDGNHPGDGFTWGGLDQMATLAADKAMVVLRLHDETFPASFEIPVALHTDFSQKDALVTIGLRRSPQMVRQGNVYWDGKKLAQCSPFMNAALLNGKESVLEGQQVVCKQGQFDFSVGNHRIKFEIDPTEPGQDNWFQIDSILIEEVPQIIPGLEVPLNECAFVVSPALGGIETEALRHFTEYAASLGAKPIEFQSSASVRAKWVIRVETVESPQELKEQFGSRQVETFPAELKPFQREEGYVLRFQRKGQAYGLDVVGLAPRGTVYAVSELELRLRERDGDVYLDFPEWDKDSESFLILEKPAMEIRGEYLNIGYNFKNITPHEWSQKRWHEYIDKLILAKLNRLYFYIWVDTYTVYPGSKLSKIPLNQRLHENIREKIDYAHKRGMEVVYMMCPTFFPRDIWLENPQIHADIEYVKHGFPAVCPRSPGAWEMMVDIWRSEMEWFAEADAIQIWFYDPGGCWCEKYGCREHQAESLAKQFKEFGALFQELNPQAKLEFSIWPIWLWEIQKGKYRQELNKLIRDQFGSAYNQLTAVGAPDTDDTLPLAELGTGFQGDVFIFGTNPETGYAFLIPNIEFTYNVIRKVEKTGVRGAFGHRLEAWPRYAGTFFMGEYLWNSDRPKEDAVVRYCNWQAANNLNGAYLTEALLLLERFTHYGADPQTGARMSELTHRVYEGLPEVRKGELEYYPAMMDALAILGFSLHTEENYSLSAFANAFGDALAKSSLFASLKERERFEFDKYRRFLRIGRAKRHF